MNEQKRQQLSRLERVVQEIVDNGVRQHDSNRAHAAIALAKRALREIQLLKDEQK